MIRPILLALACLACAWAELAATTAPHKTTKRRQHAAVTTAKPATATAHTKSSSKSAAPKTAAAKKSTARKSTKPSVSRHGKKSHRTARSYQQAPTPDRYQEIQQALASKGYYHGQVSGHWDPDSIDALKRFQADQNLTPDGKLNSLSLIALGLGPKRLTAKSASPAARPLAAPPLTDPPLAAPKAEPPQ